MADIVVLGSINMDLVVRTDRAPEGGETVSGSSFGTFPGGKGSNQAVAAARQGASVAMIGRVGADAFGEQMLASLRADGVDTSRVVIDHTTTTGVALITVEADGENRIVIVPGANGQVAPETVHAESELLSRAGVILLQLEIPLATVLHAIEAARAWPAKVVLNAAPARQLPRDVLAQVDYLVVNEVEATRMAGITPGQARDAARSLLEAGARNVVLTLGKEGAMLINKDESLHVPTFPVTPVDTTAAGDAFVGAFAAAISEGREAREAVLRGNAAGALAVTRPGAQPSMPTREETDALLASR